MSKVKILLVFLIVALLTVFSVFYIKNYFFYSAKRDISPEVLLTKKIVFEVLENNISSLNDYNDVVLENKKSFNLADYIKIEKPANQVVVHFWASWCDPCINEIPELLEYLYKKEGALADGSLSVVLVSLDYEKEALDKFLKSFPELKNPKVLQVWDKQGLTQKAFDIDRLPSTFFINADGSVEKFLTVVDWRKRL